VTSQTPVTERVPVLLNARSPRADATPAAAMGFQPEERSRVLILPILVLVGARIDHLIPFLPEEPLANFFAVATGRTAGFT
jgi:hypothetical protein